VAVFDVSNEDITKGPLLRALLVLAAPLLLQNLVTVANQLADLFFLGRFSETAVSGVSLAFPAVTLLFGLTVFAPFVGTQVLVSQRVGGADEAGARRAFGTGFALAAVLGVGVGVVTFFLAPTLVGLLTAVQPGNGSTEAVREAAIDYLRVVSLGLVAVALADTVEAGFVGWGDSRASLYINVVTVGVNVILDPLLIFGYEPLGVPRLGVEGAAIALVASSVTALAVGGVLAASGRVPGMVGIGSYRPTRADLSELLDIGGPSAAQQVARQSVRVVIIVVVFAAGGAAGLAAYFIGSRVAAIAFVPAIGLQQAAQSVAGQNIGAGNESRAGRTTWLGVAVAGVGLSVLGAIQLLFPSEVALALVPELSGDALALTETYLRILAYGYPAIGAAYLLEAGFNAARRTRVSFLATLLQFWVVRLPIAAAGAFALGHGVEAVFWAVTVSNVAVAVGLALYYRRAVDGGMLGRAVGEAAA
jgi:putative MATE family efflux protein